jgi:penicillin-binding protein 2
MPRHDDPGLRALYRRLGRVLRLSPRDILPRVIASLVQVPYADIRIKTDVTAAQRDYMEERKDQFPGVRVEQTYLRSYPNKSLAAQLIGTIGEISDRQLREKRFKGVTQGTYVGQSGLESSYDRYLRGRDGAYRILVNALGERRGAVAARAPRAGRQVKLTLDIGLQQAGERALLTAGGGRPGAFVALDPTTGAVYAMGSYPTYDPRELTKPFETKAEYDRKFGEAAGDPLFNRAIGGFYPTGSTFKPITAVAALAAGQTSPGRVVSDSGCIQIGARTIDVACNAGKVANGPVNLVRALQVSSDVYFYQMGLDLNPISSHPLQRWAKRLGLGHQTGIDVPGEGSGLVPDPAWRAQRGRLEAKCRREKHIPLTADGPTAAAQGCGISDMRPWTPGDETNLSVGQGDLQASPLQMAVAYSTIVNGGKVPRPHLGAEIQDDQGRLVQRLEAAAARRAPLEPSWRDTIMEGLRMAAGAPGGTSYDVFKDWPHDRYPIYGKTGTAERPGHADQSWYVAYAYDATRPDRHPIVIAATIEDSGFGAEYAAPAVRLMLSKWFNVKAKLIRGTSHTR